MDRWQNKVAVVTGASSGIGAAIVENFAKAGLVVVGLARRTELCEEIKKKLSSEQQSRVHFKFCDVGDVKSVEEAFDYVCKTFGGVDVLVNNAGCARGGLLAEMDIKDVQTVVNTNVMGVVYCTQAAIKSMKERLFNGHIFHINSVLGHNVLKLANSVCNIYPATKFAVTAMTEVLRHELNILKSKIKVTSISPGLVNTEILEEKFKEMMADKILQPEDIAEAILYALGTPPHVQVHELTIRPVGEVF
ncbi:DHRS11.2 family protein [Megaselia abdita]